MDDFWPQCRELAKNQAPATCATFPGRQNDSLELVHKSNNVPLIMLNLRFGWLLLSSLLLLLAKKEMSRKKRWKAKDGHDRERASDIYESTQCWLAYDLVDWRWIKS